jgi:hypothetical protein
MTRMGVNPLEVVNGNINQVIIGILFERSQM